MRILHLGLSFTLTITALLLAGVIFGDSSARAQEGAESLAVILGEVYEGDPGLASERERLREINQGVSSANQETRAAASLTANVQRVREETPVVAGGGGGGEDSGGSGGGGSSGGTSNSTPRGYGVSFSRVLPVGPRFEAKIASARAQVYGARARYEAREQELLLATIRDYMSLWRSQELLRLSGESETLSASELTVTERRLALGEGTRTEVILARSNLASARVETLSARLNRDDAAVALATRLGRGLGEVGAPELGDLPSLESLGSGRELIEGHPQMRALGFDLEGAEALLRETRGGSFPGLSVTGSVMQNFDSGGSSRSRSVSVGLTLTAPVLRQGILTDAYRARLAAHRRIVQDTEAMRRSLSQAAVRSQTRYLSSGARIVALEVSVAAAKEALFAVQEENRVGLRSQNEIISSERSLVQARTSLVSAQHDRIVSVYERLSALGLLEPGVLGMDVERYDPGPDFAASGERWQDYYMLQEPPLEEVLSAAP